MTTPIDERLADLLRPEAFDHPAREPRLIQTHISWLILAGELVYKLRKPVNFGFLDFSTSDQRRADCEAEVQLNRRLCPDLYVGVANVVERDGRLAFGGAGVPIEPAVCMRRLPESGMLLALIERGVADERLMRRIATQLADFHAEAATGPGVDEYGSPESIRANWDENFAQTVNLEPDCRAAISQYVTGFLNEHADLIERRMRQGRIRDGHGDLHAASVCATRRRLYLFDCIEFNARFRCADVAADVAFLAMDLDHLGRADLSHAFVDAYVRRSGDMELESVLDFYKCYRAFVRGKVLSFRLTDRQLPRQESATIAREDHAYFELARTYATRTSNPPQLVVTMGLPASGKTTLADSLAGRLALVHLSSDVVRKQLVGVRPHSHRSDSFERGLYSRSMTRRTYALLVRKAGRWLRRGQSVVLDATFGQPADRAAVRQLARRTRARLLVVVCEADEATIRERLAARTHDSRSESDARLELRPALRASFVQPDEVAGALHVDMTRPLEETLADVIRSVRSPGDGWTSQAA
ncbi:MAG: AAA family ATPase [Chloroflexi bacterium]|nr:AAA family ATPase [Chloroflexota bacterium]